VQRGQVLAKPGSIKPHTHFTGESMFCRRTKAAVTPVLQQLPSAVLLPYHRRDRSIELPKDKEMVMPGDNVSITVKLINPIAMEEGLRFAIREGGRTVGAGVVAKIIE
jgi:elongation factor Tu